MAQYTVTGKSSSGEGVVSVQISAINQDTAVIQELDAVNALRSFLAGTPGIVSVTAQKFEQVITNV
jgi:predicted lipase